LSIGTRGLIRQNQEQWEVGPVGASGNAGSRVTELLELGNASLRDILSSVLQSLEESVMGQRLTIVYWKGERFWLGKLLEHPEIMSQGETLEELEQNLKDAYRMMVLEDVPESYQTKEMVL